MVEPLCRPDADHYCIECCSGRGCSLLGPFSDKSLGCQGHSSFEGERTISQTPLCEEFDCLKLTGNTGTEFRQNAITYIVGLPAGQFNMSQIIEKLKR